MKIQKKAAVQSDKLDSVMGKLQEISGRIIAIGANESHYQKRTDSYLINLTNQIYEIKKTLDMLVAFKKSSQTDWSE